MVARGGSASEHYAVIVADLITMNNKLSERLRACEAALLSMPKKQQLALDELEHDQENPESEPPAKRRKNAAATSPLSIWDEWYTRVPRLWGSGDKLWRFDARLVVAYMRLFLSDGFTLQPASATFEDDVLALGAAAETAMFAFQRARDINAASYGTVLREMRKLQRTSSLNEHSKAFRILRVANHIADRSPSVPYNILAPRFACYAL